MVCFELPGRPGGCTNAATVTCDVMRTRNHRLTVFGLIPDLIKVPVFRRMQIVERGFARFQFPSRLTGRPVQLKLGDGERCEEGGQRGEHIDRGGLASPLGADQAEDLISVDRNETFDDTFDDP